MPDLNGETWTSCVSNVKMAASSPSSFSQLRTCVAASRAFFIRSSMLPLTSNSMATLTPASSLRNSVIWRGTPPSSTSKSFAVRLVTKRPFLSRTTALIRTRSLLDLKVATGPWPCPAGTACLSAVAPTPKLPIESTVTNNSLIVPAAYLQAECQVLKLFIARTLDVFLCSGTASAVEKSGNCYAVGHEPSNHYAVAILRAFMRKFASDPDARFHSRISLDQAVFLRYP